jgi:hypothetical protein
LSGKYSEIERSYWCGYKGKTGKNREKQGKTGDKLKERLGRVKNEETMHEKEICE